MATGHRGLRQRNHFQLQAWVKNILFHLLSLHFDTPKLATKFIQFRYKLGTKRNLNV